MDAKEIKKIINLAKKSGIKVFKLGELEFAFGSEVKAQTRAKRFSGAHASQDTNQAIDKNPTGIPTLDEVNAYIYNQDTE